MYHCSKDVKGEDAEFQIRCTETDEGKGKVARLRRNEGCTGDKKELRVSENFMDREI